MHGIKQFRITTATLNYITNNFTIVSRKIVGNDDIERPSLNDTNKVIKIGYHIASDILVLDETEANFNTLLALLGDDCVLYPHQDSTRKYSCKVVNVEPIQDRTNYNIKVLIQLISTKYVTYDSNILATKDLLSWNTMFDPYYDSNSGNWFIRDITGDYFPENGQPRQRYILDFNNGVSNQYVNSGIKPSEIIEGQPFEMIIKHIEQTAYLYDAKDATNDFGAYNNSTASKYSFFYGDGSNNIDIISWSLLTVSNWYKFQLSLVGSNYNYKVFDLKNNQIGSTVTVPVPATLPDLNIDLSAKMHDGTITNYYNNQIAEFTRKNITWYFGLEEVGKYIVGSTGSILEIKGYTAGIYNFDNTAGMPISVSPNFKGFVKAETDNYIDNSGTDIYAENAIVRQDPNNITKGFAWKKEGIEGFVKFDGTDDWVDTQLKEITTTGDFTISFWWNGNNTPANDTDHILSNYTDSSHYFTIKRVGAYQKFEIFIRGAGGFDKVRSAVVHTTVGWNHCVVSRKFISGANVYEWKINDVASTEIFADIATIPTTGLDTTFEMGRDSNAYGVNSFRKNVIIYNKVLSDEDKTKLYEEDYASMTDNPTTSANCVAWYRCDEASGSLIDRSVNGNDAIVHNADASFYNQTATYTQKLLDYKKTEFPILLNAENWTIYKMSVCPEFMDIDNRLTFSYMFSGGVANALNNTNIVVNRNNQVFMENANTTRNIIISKEILNTGTTPTLSEVENYENLT